VDKQIEEAFVALLGGDETGYLQKYSAATGDIPEEEGRAKENDQPKAKISKKGDARQIISCSEVETLVFGPRGDPMKTAGRRRNRLPRGVVEMGEWRSVDMEDPPPPSAVHHTARFTHEEDSYSESSDTDQEGGVGTSSPFVAWQHSTIIDTDHIPLPAGRQRPPQSQSEVNGSVGGEKGWTEKIEESEEMLEKRREGQKRAKEREMVRRAARRGVVFGFEVVGDNDGEEREFGVRKGKGGMKGKGKKGKEGKGRELDGVEHDEEGARRRKCEAVVTKAAVVVEPSFAKGDWGVRWR